MTRALAIAGLCLALFLAGCEKAARDMYDQPRDDPYAASALFADGQSARAPETGVIVRSAGRFAGASSGRTGVEPLPGAPPPPAAGGTRVDGHWMPTLAGIPLEVTRALLERGRQRYDIYCAPCHGLTGEGDGMVVQRGFAAPPSYHSVGLRNAPDAHLYDVISNGFGRMFAYGGRVAPEDRWAIVAYIRALQLSQYAPIAELDAQERDALDGGVP